MRGGGPVPTESVRTMSRLAIQFASNLKSLPPFPLLLKPVAPVLALVHVSGHYQQNMSLYRYCSRNWPYTFVVGADEINVHLPRVYFLEQERFTVDNVAFLGAEVADPAWLAAEVAASEEAGRPTVIITRSIPPANLSFVREPVRAWISDAEGVALPGGVPYVANPHGASGYCRDRMIEVSAEPGSGGDTRDPLLVAAAAGAQILS